MKNISLSEFLENSGMTMGLTGVIRRGEFRGERVLITKGCVDPLNGGDNVVWLIVKTSNLQVIQCSMLSALFSGLDFNADDIELDEKKHEN